MGQLSEIASVISGTPNRIINGNFLIDQQNEGAAYTLNASGTIFGPDGWKFVIANRTTLNQIATVIPGVTQISGVYYGNTLVFQGNGATDNGTSVRLRQIIEGVMLDEFTPGFSTGKTAVLQFAARGLGLQSQVLPITLTASTPGADVYATSVVLPAVSGKIGALFGVEIPLTALSNTWSRTSGTVGLTIDFWLQSQAADVVANNNKNRWIAGGGASCAEVVNLLTQAGAGLAEFAITNVALYRGQNLPQLPYLSVDDELRRCQRYYEKSFSLGVAPVQNVGNSQGAAAYYAKAAGVANDGVPIEFSAQKPNAAYTVTTYNPNAANANWRNTTLLADSGVPAATFRGTRSMVLTNPQAAGDALNDAMAVHWVADARL